MRLQPAMRGRAHPLQELQNLAVLRRQIEAYQWFMVRYSVPELKDRLRQLPQQFAIDVLRQCGELPSKLLAPDRRIVLAFQEVTQKPNVKEAVS